MNDSRGGRMAKAAAALAAAMSAGCLGGAPPRREAPSAPLEARTSAQKRADRLELAYEQIRLKRWPRAIILLGDLIAEDPGDMRLRMERGYVRQSMGEQGAAADEFTVVARSSNPFQEQARQALHVIAAQSSPASDEVLHDGLLNAGYDDLRRGENDGAREKFEKVLEGSPGKSAVAKQLAYMSLADGDLVSAAESLERVRRLSPLDYQTSLELGYLYDSLKNSLKAEDAFVAALPSPDPKVHDAAKRALDNIRSRTAPIFFDVYAAPYYTTRFSNKIIGLDARAGYRPVGTGPVSLYLAARCSQDSRSRSGSVPDIYSDNVVIIGPGIELQPSGFNARLAAEWGVALNLLRTAEHPRAAEGAGRVVLSDYGYWTGARRLFADAGGSVGYYSRYRNNVIADLQLRAGVRAWDAGAGKLWFYLPFKVMRDANRDFYNNIIEFGAGAEMQPLPAISLKLRLEWLAGRYLGISGRDPNPYPPSYRDLRLLLVYSGHFARRARAKAVRPAPRRHFVW